MSVSSGNIIILCVATCLTDLGIDAILVYWNKKRKCAAYAGRCAPRESFPYFSARKGAKSIPTSGSRRPVRSPAFGWAAVRVATGPGVDWRGRGRGASLAEVPTESVGAQVPPISPSCLQRQPSVGNVLARTGSFGSTASPQLPRQSSGGLGQRSPVVPRQNSGGGGNGVPRQGSQGSLFEQIASQAKDLVRETTRQSSQDGILAHMDKVRTRRSGAGGRPLKSDPFFLFLYPPPPQSL
jgi:hypothetical protein